LLDRLFAFADIGERNKAPVTIALGAELLQPQVAPADKRLQGAAAVVGNLDCRQPQFTPIGEQQRAPVPDAGDRARADVGELAGVLRHQTGQKGGQDSRRQEGGEQAGKKTFHEPDCLNWPERRQ